MKRAFVDTSAWYAFANAADPDHRAIRAVLGAFLGRLVTTNFVFDETVTLCRTRLGHAAAVKVGDTLRTMRSLDLVRVSARDEDEAWSLLVARPDKDCSFTDCTSFVVMRRLTVTEVFAFDDDFRREGFAVAPAGGKADDG